MRGQYGPGIELGRPVPGYREEEDVAPDLTVETFAALKLGIDNWRWAGVPFYLRTGKRMPARSSEIAIQFRQAPYAMFRDTPIERLPANIMTLRIQPDEGLSVTFSAKQPGPEIQIAGVAMNFSYRSYFEPLAAVGYETLSTIACWEMRRCSKEPTPSRQLGALCSGLSKHGRTDLLQIFRTTPPELQARRRQAG